jgi:hypothetical protein
VAYPETWLRAAIEDATGCRTFPVQAAEAAATPFVVYQRTGTERERSTMANPGVPVATFSIVVYADTYTGAKELAERVRLAVDDFQGEEGGVRIERATLTDEADGDVVDFAGEGKPTYSVVLTFEVRFREGV